MEDTELDRWTCIVFPKNEAESMISAANLLGLKWHIRQADNGHDCVIYLFYSDLAMRVWLVDTLKSAP